MPPLSTVVCRCGRPARYTYRKIVCGGCSMYADHCACPYIPIIQQPLSPLPWGTIVGPLRCQSCKVPVFWTRPGYMTAADGRTHHC